MTLANHVRTALAGAVFSAALITGLHSASAASAAVEEACASDYFAYCSKHDPDGPGVRSCMRAVGSRLSPRCIKALAAAGEIPGQKVRRASRN